MRRLKLMLLVGLGVGAGTMACSPSDTGSTGGTGGSTSSTGSGGRTTGGSGGSTGGGGSSSSSGSGGSSSTGTGGSTGSGGSGSSGTGGSGPSGSGGSTSPGGTGGSSGDARPADMAGNETAPPKPDGGGAGTGDKFSFFVTSIDALRKLSGNNKGFGGDLRYGEADGLAGADKICREIAEMALPGAGAKPWKAFLSVVSGPGGMPVNAADRVGDGPWYDRVGRLVAMTKADLLQPRPKGADPKIINDLPNEMGLPNAHPAGREVDNHHMLTGSKAGGLLHSMNKSVTCQDWTSKVGTDGKPQCGVAWPRSQGDSWIAWGPEGGCAPGFNIVTGAGATEGGVAVGSNGGYGGFYCFSTVP
jgi:hypothetical protein